MLITKKIIAAICAVLCLAGAFQISLAADASNNYEAVSNDEGGLTDSTDILYSDFIDEYKNSEKPLEEITFGSDSISAEESQGYEIDGENNCVLDSEKSKVTYSFSVSKTGLYHMSVKYLQINDSKITDPTADILIDGHVPYASAANISFKRLWRLDGEKQYDKRGNELHRNWAQYPVWQEDFIYDCEGRYNEPLYFYLTEGMHSLAFDFEYSGISVKSVTFSNIKAPEKYSSYGKEPSDGEDIFIEAEDFKYVSDSSIAVNIDKSNPDVTPNAPENLQYNTVGGDSFSERGQTVFWEMSVEKTGYYYVGFKARQNIKKGYFSTRQFAINGEIPYEECENICFTYSDEWKQFILSDVQNTPMLFYFEAGKSYELSLKCVPGELSEVMSALDSAIETLNGIFLSVRMVVGNSADEYRDYYLKEDIPGIEKNVADVLAKLEEQKNEIQKTGKTDGGELSALQTVITQLGVFKKNIDTIALKLESFKSNISSLSAWVNELKSQPLEIDSLLVSGDISHFGNKKSGFFSRLIFNLKRLILSFSESYGVVGDYSGDEELTVWISTGQDQMDVIRNMIVENGNDEYYVQLQLVPTGLLEAAMAGKGPDVAMFIAGDMPVNLASRGGLIDMSGLDGFAEAAERFADNALVPYTYEDGCYALPLTQSFNMLFVRTDIFNELGLNVPDTWEDFFEILPILQRNNLEAGIPSDLSTFATLALQNGGTFYSADLTSTSFDETAEMNAFKDWTNLFTEKGLPLAYDFSNRFRTGEMPIGIADYSTYALLETSAPEISGRWAMYPIMATTDGNGEKNRNISSATVGTVGLQQGNTCAVILKDCSNVSYAWDFICWFTDTQTQISYGLELEKRLGVAARYASANVEALRGLPWTGEQLNLLYEQWENLVLLPEIPGSYYVTRNLNNAFRQVVYNQENPVHTLNKYNEIINREIERKRKGLLDDA